jgi:hypothetical protein
LSAGITIFGVASDDVHELKRPFVRTSARPGLGWIVVRAPRLTADAILAAMARGDFYASTGVELTDIQATPRRVAVAIKEQSYARYTVQFIGKVQEPIRIVFVDFADVFEREHVSYSLPGVHKPASINALAVRPYEP